ncbi:double-stranded RNA-binding protein 4-like isoform X2 [Magnolia sinica]|uniref:double-stranded RNA-binding protein 4-like isoform X2 n=1 Tax=Magnolia sinica TaxID=86752 RepID=UPI0026587A56|nr:double-stranded RNA-binding protein 4-like isoform X2 [Magnolia sinica]
MEETRRLQLASASKPCTPAHLMHKNRLQEYAQRLALQFPIYHSINEGFPHAPKFRASVVVDGEEYESTQTFPHQKDAEQDVAKIALESIFKRIKNEAYSFIYEDTLFCKSILTEFAVKMNLEMPKYNTQSVERLSAFVSSLIFNGKCYTGEARKNKKEAEQMVARTAILSFLGNADCPPSFDTAQDCQLVVCMCYMLLSFLLW